MHQLHQFISVLNSSLKSGNLFFRTTKTKFILQVVHLLMKHQYFTGYKACVNNPSHIIIFFKLMPGCQQSLLVKCTLATNSSCPRYFR